MATDTTVYTDRLEQLSEELNYVKLYALQALCYGRFFDVDTIDTVYDNLAGVKKHCDTAWEHAYKLMELSKSDVYRLEGEVDCLKRKLKND